MRDDLIVFREFAELAEHLPAELRSVLLIDFAEGKLFGLDPESLCPDALHGSALGTVAYERIVVTGLADPGGPVRYFMYGRELVLAEE